MTDDAAPRDRQPRQLIYNAWARAEAARGQLADDLTQGGVSDETMLDLARAALGFYNVLRQYGDEDAAEDAWADVNIDPLLAAAGRTVERPEPAPGDTAAQKAVEQPAVLALPHTYYDDCIQSLVQVAKDLGFSAEPAERTPRATDEPPEVPDHIKAEAPAYQEATE